MPGYYFDTSAIVKRYVPETGAAWVRGIVDDDANQMSIVDLTRAEVAGALARRTREGVIALDERDDLLREFHRHCTERYRPVPAGHEVIDRAVQLTQRHPLRAYDAVQLGTSLIVNQALLDSGLPELTFVCADDRLLEAAEVEGLAVDDPNRHP